MASHSIVCVDRMEIVPTLRSTNQHLWSFEIGTSISLIVEISIFDLEIRFLMQSQSMCSYPYTVVTRTPWVQSPITRCACVRSNTPTNATHNHCPQTVVTTAGHMYANIDEQCNPSLASQHTCACTHMQYIACNCISDAAFSAQICWSTQSEKCWCRFQRIRDADLSISGSTNTLLAIVAMQISTIKYADLNNQRDADADFNGSKMLICRFQCRHNLFFINKYICCNCIKRSNMLISTIGEMLMPI